MKIIWGQDPYFFGPRDYFKNALIVKEVQKITKRNVKILDFGCGCGNLTLKLAELGYYLTGFDVSLLSLDVLKNKVGKSNVKKSIKIEDNIEKLKKNISEFKIICAGEVLEHIRDDREIVRIFRKILMKDGFCVLTVPARKKYWDKSDEAAGHFRRYEKEELRSLFTSEGFEIKKIYCFGPVSLFWQKFIFLPVFLKRLSSSVSIKHKRHYSLLSHLIWLNKILVYIFFIDLIFVKLNCWNNYLMVAYKK
jgi:SAM-dependent methyltransferase